jgi:hypothetical protein
MPLREETISGPGYSFVCSNKKATSRGTTYMTDAEFDAHKSEQRANMEASIVTRQVQAAEEATRLAALDKLRALGLTDEEIRALGLSRG